VTVCGPSGSSLDGYDALSKTGDGTLTLTEVHSVSGNLEITGGFLRLSEPSTPTFSAGVTTTVTGTGALELAGSVSVLTNKVNVANNSTAARVVVSERTRVIGSISGTVSWSTPAAASRQLDRSRFARDWRHRCQSAIVTIASSDASEIR
jgi:autotransporter-associated beta strand protein